MISLGQLRVIWMAMIGGTASYTLVIFTLVWLGTIVGLALMEGGGLVVITLGLVSSSPTWILAGGGAAVGMMALARPTAEEAGIES